MAWLFLDTHAAGTFRWGWLGGRHEEIFTRRGRASVLLVALAKARARLRSADGICVVAGPGSFSSVRTGVLYANLLSRLLRLPLVGVGVTEAEDLSELARALGAGRLAASRYVAPVYDAEPNITLPKSA